MKNFKIKRTQSSIDRALKIADMDLIPVSIFNIISNFNLKVFPKIYK